VKTLPAASVTNHLPELFKWGTYYREIMWGQRSFNYFQGQQDLRPLSPVCWIRGVIYTLPMDEAGVINLSGGSSLHGLPFQDSHPKSNI
jgi:hypothetical protein